MTFDGMYPNEFFAGYKYPVGEFRRPPTLADRFMQYSGRLYTSSVARLSYTFGHISGRIPGKFSRTSMSCLKMKSASWTSIGTCRRISWPCSRRLAAAGN